MTTNTILHDFPRGTSRDQPGTASNNFFASIDAILKAKHLHFNPRGNPEGKLFLGVINGVLCEGKRLLSGYPDYWIDKGMPIGIADDRHICTIAGSRAGKGRSALLTNLLSYPATGSMLVIDPKGDLARLTACYRANILRQQVVVLDPFGVAGPDTAQFAKAFNPLRLLIDSPSELYASNAAMIAEALVVPGNSKDPHWDDCARDMLGSGLCLHVATHPNYEGRRDLVTVLELSTDLLQIDPNDPEKCQLETEMENNLAAGGAVRAAARAFYERSGGELSSVVSTLRKHLRWISYEPVKKSLRGPSIDLRDLQREAMTVYVSLPAMQMNALSGWLRLVVQLSLVACETSGVTPKHPVLFMLDEFNVLGRLESIETAIAQIAGFGVRLWIVLQDLGQLRKYDNWETFIGNTGVLQAFGNSDVATLEYLSKLLGSTQVINPSVNAKSYQDAVRRGASGDSYSIGMHPLLAPEEIAHYFGRDDRQSRQLILRPGKRPMVLQRAFYDKHELFRGKCKKGN